jgi:hypothetical protein
MRQSTAPFPDRGWMDRERAFDEWLCPDKFRVDADRFVRLMRVRRELLHRRVAQLQARNRVPRVCLYMLSVGDCKPTHSLEAACAFASEQGWQVGGCYTDRHDETAPMARSGWGQVLQQICAGYVDGVVVLTHSVISSDVDTYEQQVVWFEVNFGFLALVTAEVEAPAVGR